MGGPFSGQTGSQWVEEIRWRIYCEMVGVDDVTQKMIHRTNDHLLEFFEGDWVLALI